MIAMPIDKFINITGMITMIIGIFIKIPGLMAMNTVFFPSVPDIFLIAPAISFKMAGMFPEGLGADGVNEAAPLLRVVAVVE